MSSENRAKSHEELQERFQKKLEEIRSKKHQGNSVSNKNYLHISLLKFLLIVLSRKIFFQDKLKAKLSKSMKKAEKKKREKEAMKQTLIKAGKHSGNLNKVSIKEN